MVLACSVPLPHNCGQLFTLYLLIPGTGIFYLLPWALLLALPSGWLTGYLAQRILDRQPWAGEGGTAMVELEGVVERITFYNEENGYTVARFKTATEQLTVVGVLPNISAGESLRLGGEWTLHPTYGRQFKVETFEDPPSGDGRRDRGGTWGRV